VLIRTCGGERSTGKFQCRKKIPKVQMGIWPKEIELNRKEEEKV
jgi:hypothetical protein